MSGEVEREIGEEIKHKQTNIKQTEKEEKALGKNLLLLC